MQIDSDDVAGAKEEEGEPGEERAGDHVRLDGLVPALVAEEAPHGRGDRVGAVLQAEQQAHFPLGEVEAAEDLGRE